ncbi:MAG: preprotein translocase subunit SecG [Acidobacteriota bacterium]
MILSYLMTAVYVLVCMVLLLLILLQQGKGDMAAAFGGGSSQSAFGARAGATVLSKATAVLAGLFMFGALGLAIIGQRGGGSVVSGTPAPPRPLSAPAAPGSAPAGTSPAPASTPAPGAPSAPTAPTSSAPAK